MRIGTIDRVTLLAHLRLLAGVPASPMPGRLHLFLLLLSLATPALAAPPPPPAGYAWVRNETFSDEFDGTTLDQTKWFDHHPTWKGRPPAKFVPEAVSVRDGQLQIHNGTLSQPDGSFTLFGGAVVSRSEEAFYGYYEARMQASRISMSSTFWLSQRAIRVDGASVSTEIDIIETIGAPQRHPQWNRQINSNLHVFHTPEGGGKVDLSSPGKAPIDPPADEAFHTYAAWWVDANTVQFYLDDKFQFTLHPRTDFSSTPLERPMHVNLVTETYNWEIPPTPEAVNNPALNTTRYDWVRAYTLQPIGASPAAGK